MPNISEPCPNYDHLWEENQQLIDENQRLEHDLEALYTIVAILLDSHGGTIRISNCAHMALGTYEITTQHDDDTAEIVIQLTPVKAMVVTLAAKEKR